jgi:hypothetical protein
MIDFIKGIDSAVNLLSDIKKAGNKNELLRYAINAEAKFNNDLADVICRANANTIAQSAPNLFKQFSITTSEVLIAIGTPAYKILRDEKAPLNKDIQELDNSSASKSLFEKKAPSELYEFYIRKCLLLRALHEGSGLTATKISLQKRCQNVRLSTSLLIKKIQSIS